MSAIIIGRGKARPGKAWLGRARDGWPRHGVARRGIGGRAIVVFGLGLGDEGKGAVVDYLVREHGVRTVVRHGGGAQAAHNVVLPDGRSHTFAQFGAGTLAGAATLLGPQMLVNPLTMVPEAAHLESLGVEDPWGLLSVDERAVTSTIYHMSTNRLKEMARGDRAHGSCGMGIGETRQDIEDGLPPLTMGDIRDGRDLPLLRGIRDHALLKLAAFRAALPDTEEAQRELDVLMSPPAAASERLRDVVGRVRVVGPAHLAAVLAEDVVVFEGAQGVLLDEVHGFNPHTTWADTTSRPAEALLRGYGGEVVRLGVLRSYATRHGAGPLPTEEPSLRAGLPEPHNAGGRWQGAFRVGHLDLALASYAVRATGGVDALAVTHLDRVDRGPVRRASPALLAPANALDLWTWEGASPRYEEVQDPEFYLDAIERDLGAPVILTSRGPTAADKALVPAGTRA